jgi:hypothetical protein
MSYPSISEAMHRDNSSVRYGYLSVATTVRKSEEFAKTVRETEARYRSHLRRAYGAILPDEEEAGVAA